MGVGYKSLFGVGNHITRINGLSQEESKRLHDYFLQLIVENIDVQVRHRWLNENDVGKCPHSAPGIMLGSD